MYLRMLEQLKRKLNAVILSHYYQDDEIQEVADFIGDSLALARYAQKTDADVIVLCGVRFMAETALILNQTKKVIIPDINAGCSLEKSCPHEDFKSFIQKFPDHVVVTYINSSVEVKALSDVIVTSSNAVKIINSIPKDKKIIFAPDKRLGAYLIKQTGRDMVLWNGVCIVHDNFSEQELLRLVAQHPSARIIAHPECAEHMLRYAEHIGSTSSLIEYTGRFVDQEFIILTEPGVIYQMKKVSPSNRFYAVKSLELSCQGCSKCPYMRLNNIEKLHKCMAEMSPQIVIEPAVLAAAQKSLVKMLDLS